MDEAVLVDVEGQSITVLPVSQASDTTQRFHLPYRLQYTSVDAAAAAAHGTDDPVTPAQLTLWVPACTAFAAADSRVTTKKKKKAQ